MPNLTARQTELARRRAYEAAREQREQHEAWEARQVELHIGVCHMPANPDEKYRTMLREGWF